MDNEKRYSETDRQTDRQTDTWTDTDRQIDRQTHRQTNKQTDGQMYRWTYGRVRSGQVRSNRVWSGQIKSGQIRSCQVRSGKIQSGQVRSDQVKSYKQDASLNFWFLFLHTGISNSFDTKRNEITLKQMIVQKFSLYILKGLHWTFLVYLFFSFYDKFWFCNK